MSKDVVWSPSIQETACCNNLASHSNYPFLQTALVCVPARLTLRVPSQSAVQRPNCKAHLPAKRKKKKKPGSDRFGNKAKQSNPNSS